MDISDTLAPNSDQLDACDLTTGPRIFTVASVSKGSVEQPVDVHLVEFPRVWRPSKGMRRVLAACWGVDASAWVGRRVELYCDPSVMFGKDAVGGTRIRSLSHIDGQKKIPLLVSRGKSAVFTVQALADSEGGQSHVTPSQDPPGSSRTTMPGTSATARRESEASDGPEPLLDAIRRQVTSMSGEEKDEFAAWLVRERLGTKLGSISERFGEDARDIRRLMCEQP